MAYMSHGRADAESLLDFMDSQRRLTSEILTIFLGQLTSANVTIRTYRPILFILLGVLILES